jgi:hypothetical protein
MNIASKYNITVPVKVADCPLILTITGVAERTFRNSDGSNTTADVITGTDERNTARFARLNPITVEQLIRIHGPETDAWIGKRVLVSTYQKGDRSYLNFAPAPVAPIAPPTFLPGPEAAAAPKPITPRKNRRKAPALNDAAKAAIHDLEQTLKS